MNDLTTFSGAEDELLEHGFLLGFENTWRSEFYTEALPFKIFIHPTNPVLIVLEGYSNNRLNCSKIMSVWTQNNDINDSNFCYKIPRLGGITYIDIVSDNKNVGNTSLFSQHSCSSVAPGLEFKNLLYYYTILLEENVFLSWGKQPNLNLLNPEEMDFLGSANEEKENLNQSRLKIAIDNLGLDSANFGIK